MIYILKSMFFYASYITFFFIILSLPFFTGIFFFFHFHFLSKWRLKLIILINYFTFFECCILKSKACVWIMKMGLDDNENAKMNGESKLETLVATIVTT